MGEKITFWAYLLVVIYLAIFAYRDYRYYKKRTEKLIEIGLRSWPPGWNHNWELNCEPKCYPPGEEVPKDPNIMIECILTCVNYGDFLAVTLPAAKQHFNYLVVVTDTKDEYTSKLCQYYNVHCIQTDVFYKDDAKFNKAAALNEGMKVLSKSGWVVHIDADIYLPPHTRQILDMSLKDTKGIYGADRMMCRSYEEWTKYIANPKLQQENNIFVHPPPFDLGVRLFRTKQANPDKNGYVPIGFFQAWNPGGSGFTDYAQGSFTAEHDDMMQALRFTREHRHLLGELFVIHLESEKAEKMGVNWMGRKTIPFGPVEIKQEEKENECS